MTTSNLLQDLKSGEPWDRSVLTAAKTAMFNQTTSGSTNATSISKITLAYFISSDCTGVKAGTGFYTTPDGSSFTIQLNKPFGLVASSAWNVGSNKLSISNMTTIQSIAVTFKSTNNNTPQSNFSGVSFACLPVTCTAGPLGVCTSGSSTQNFTLKTTASIGDPADSGVIACMNAAITPPANAGFLVAPKVDNNTSVRWGGDGTTTGATSLTNGSANTATIITTLGSSTTYAARVCSTYAASGGYTSGWFLPAKDQLNCLYVNKTTIGGTFSLRYWSSSETNSTTAFAQNFTTGNQAGNGKSNLNSVRCVRSSIS
jgi:hypothetical protein